MKSNKWPRLCAAALALLVPGLCRLQAGVELSDTSNFSTGFEASEGYTGGYLQSDTLWQVGGSSDPLIGDFGFNATQALELDVGAALSIDFSSATAPPVGWIDLYLKPAFSVAGDLPVDFALGQAALTGFVKVGGEGEIYVLHGDGAGNGQWMATGTSVPLSGNLAADWLRMTYRLDYATQRWDLFLNSQLQLIDLGFIDPNAPPLSAFRIIGSSEGATRFDQFEAGFSNPLFTDADNDGIADAYESAQGLDVSLNDRDFDNDFDSVPNVIEYISGLQAGDPDSDGDGVSDGDELAAGADPASADLYDLSAVPFFEDFESFAQASIAGLQRWAVNGGTARVQSLAAFDGVQALILESGQTLLELSNHFDGSEGARVWIDFQIQPTLFPMPDALPAGTIEADATAVFFFSPGGQITLLDGDGSGSGSWRLFSHAAAPSAWQRVTLLSDYSTQSYSLWINGVRVAQDMGFATQQPFFKRFMLKQGIPYASILDALRVDFQKPFGLDTDGDGLTDEVEDANGNGTVDPGESDLTLADTDGDGLPDGWEVQYGLDPLADDATLDLDGDGLANADEFAQATDPQIPDTDGDTYSDGEEFIAGTSPVDAQALPQARGYADWTLTNMNQTAPTSVFTVDGSAVIHAPGYGVRPNGYDQLSFLHKTIEGDFSFTIRIKEFERDQDGAEVGIMVRRSIASQSQLVALSAQGDPVQREYHFFDRQGDWAALGVTGYATEYYAPYPNRYLRVVKLGDVFSLFISRDGLLFEEIETLQSDFGGPFEIGVSIDSINGETYARALVDFESLFIDSDQDGLWNSEEAAIGTDPLLADTDGDGISDHDESRTYLSNPHVSDIGASELVHVVDLTSGSGLLGEWVNDGNGVHSNSAGGGYRQPITLDADGLYELDIVAMPYNYAGYLSEYEVAVSVDGQFVQRVDFKMLSGESSQRKVVLPWLEAGAHAIDLRFVNFKQNRNIQFASIALNRHGGVDSDANGKADWIDYRLDLINGIEASSLSSVTSPYCLEGRSRYPAMVAVNAQEALPAPADRWYADIELNPDATADVSVSFENGGLHQSHSIIWTPTNLVESDGGALRIRKGDSLLLTAVPVGTNSGTIEIAVADQPIISSPVNTPVPVLFDQAGRFVVTGTWVENGSSSFGQIEVEVVEASFASSPIAMVSQIRPWEHPGLPSGVVLETDARMFVAEGEPSVEGSRVLDIATDALEPRSIAARLSANGPILATQSIRALRAATTNATSYRLVEQYEDGTGLYEVAVVLAEVYPEVEVHLDILVSGVMFDDGAKNKILRSADFNEMGVSFVYFIRPGTSMTSICHSTYIYDTTIKIGKPRG